VRAVSRRALIVGHADADGHLITEQTRRNLARLPGFEVDTLVDAVRTKGHKAWLSLDALGEVEDYDYVFFVDLMFAPASFESEADALLRFVEARPRKRFYVFDHHPLPTRRLTAKNLRTVYRRDVFDCALGTPSPLMVVAALCEHQPTRAKEMKSEVDDLRALGMKRAATGGSPLVGEKLSALVRADRWGEIEALGREPSELNPRPRNIRPKDAPLSAALKALDALATKLVRSSKAATRGGNAMAYEPAQHHPAPRSSKAPMAPVIPPAYGRDLEAIVSLLELAAIQLTTGPGVAFTRQQLLDAAREFGGDEIELEAADVDIVIGKSGFLKKVAGGQFCLK